MHSVRQWLEQLGLPQHAEVFERNAIDPDVLCELTEKDLENLGVHALGHRKKLLKAIAELNGSKAATATAVPIPASRTPIERGSAGTEGERRQLTVLFCDMVGFTELASRVDPEVLQGIIRSYEDACAACVTRYEGYVFQRLGDGIVAFFGYPLAHEGEAERAIRAGLEIIEALSKLDIPDAGHLAVRIGIATGLVVVSSAEKGAVGETMNLASRLQGIAPVGSIVVSERVHRLAGGAFDYEDMGEQTLKGISRPTHAFRILGTSAAASRFEAATQEGLTPLVGREPEIGHLVERWQLAREGEGQAVLLSGEPGVGKSRILSALRERLQNEVKGTLRFQCSPYYGNSAFYPFIDNFERALQFARDASPESRLDKLETLVVGQLGRPLADVRFIASILSIPTDERYGPLPMMPQKQKDETIRVLVDLTEAAARREPSLMLFEDAHWADPTTLEVLDLLTERIRQVPLLVVITHRPEFQSRWPGREHVTTLNLSKLTRVQSSAMVSKLAGGKALPAELHEQIIAKTDGVPLFVEELTKSVLESTVLRDVGDHYVYAGAAGAVTIPATLRDSLMARLDRFMPVKEIAQIGAAIGREFSHELIAAVAQMTRADLDDGLRRLTESGLAFRRGTPPEATYTFKHALIRDAAYESLLKSKRYALHNAIAEALQTRFSEMAANEPDVLAHHYTEAQLHAQATTYWIAAARRAVERFANAEAIGYVDRGLRTLKALPAGTERDQKELLLQVHLGTALGSSKGFTPPEVGQAFARARDLCERVGQTPQMLVILDGLWIYYVMRAEYDTGGQIDDQVLDLARRTNDSAGLVAGHQNSCGTALFRGEFERAVEQGDKGWAAYNEEEHKNIGVVYSRNPAIVSLDFSAWALLSMGYLDRAVERHAEAVRLAIKEGYPLTIATVTAHAGCVHYIRDDAKSTLEVAQQVIAWCKESGILIRQTEGEMLEGWAIAEMGDTKRGIPQLEAALNLWNMIGAQIANPIWYSCLSRAYQKAGRMDEARSALQKGIEFVRKNREGLVEAEVHRLDGELRLAIRQDDPAAESCLRTAIQIAKAQKAKLFELRASASLAKLWQSQSKRRAAHDLLAPVYNWFTEGFDTKDLKDARMLLKDLEA